MNKNQKLLSTLNVSSVELDNLIKATREAGAYGAKLSGAGGGDCMIAFVNNENRKIVIDSIVEAGGIWMNVATGAEGVRLE